ncbi:antibiotic biosynthesis monooxygenase [Flexivirga meconopsidis]|uniref:antibiotic biosynthesis monooxygenase n=1 Tax=Flexivirga meconopsidis TaxID=2977121 RepID=UPI002240AF81|nr:antibiotic biosynthesis monooxygenase [Flexivirga meconopsidis]
MTQLAESRTSAVTVAITRRVQPGNDEQMLAWINAGTALAERFPGFLGTGWVRPRGDSDEWHMLYRFDDADALRAWEDSEQRKWWLRSGVGMVEDRVTHRRVGIEGWFDPPSSETTTVAAPKVPPRWKQATMIWLAFFPLSLVVNVVFAPVLSGWSLPVRVLATTVFMTPLMTYFVLPAMSRLLHRWLTR